MFLGPLLPLDKALAAVTGNGKMLHHQALRGMVQHLLPPEITHPYCFSLLAYLLMKKVYLPHDIAQSK